MKFKQPCHFCKDQHYSIICSKAPADMNDGSRKVSIINLKADCADNAVFSWTAQVWAEVGDRRVLCRILIDSGSQSTHITQSMARKLHSMPSSQLNMAMSTAGGQVTNMYNCGVHDITLRSRFDHDKSINIQAIEMKCLSRTKFPIIRETFGLTPVADHAPNEERELVDLLLGNDRFRKSDSQIPEP